MAFTLPIYHPPDFAGPPLKSAPLVRFAPVLQEGIAPENYHATTIFPEYFQLTPDHWVLLKDSRMDGVVVRPKAGLLQVKEFRHLKIGEQVALGRGENGEEGIYVHTGAFAEPQPVAEKFAFRTHPSRETSFSVDYDELYDLLSFERENGFILWVLGPAAVFDRDSRNALVSLIERGFVHGLLAGNALAGRLPAALRHALAQAGVPRGHVGLVIQPLGRRRPTVALNAGKLFDPASVMKTLTTLSALDTLGPAYTFKTTVLTGGPVSNGVLHGDLILRGGGDPALNLEHFWTLLRAIRTRGIREIDGDVILDDSLFAIPPVDPAGFDDQPLKPYNAEPAALLVNYNALPLYLAPDGTGVSALLDFPCLTVCNRLAFDRGAACGDWEDALSVSRDGRRLEVSGQYPAACGDRTLWLNLMRPPATAAAVFETVWAELGGRLTGHVRLGTAPATAAPLLDFDSPELSEIVRGTNKFSNNVMAKMLFLDLGAIRYGPPATWDKGRAALRAWLKEKRIAMPGLDVDNGSGLSRSARVSAASVARLLAWAARQPLYYEFAASLPALGLEGTQRHRLNGTPLAGRAWLKSGSLDGIHNLAGYVLDADGRRAIFVLFIEDAPARTAKRVQVAALRWAIDRRHVLH